MTSSCVCKNCVWREIFPNDVLNDTKKQRKLKKAHILGLLGSVHLEEVVEERPK